MNCVCVCIKRIFLVVKKRSSKNKNKTKMAKVEKMCKKKKKCCAVSEFGNSFALEDFIEKNQTKHPWRI